MSLAVPTYISFVASTVLGSGTFGCAYGADEGPHTPSPQARGAPVGQFVLKKTKLGTVDDLVMRDDIVQLAVLPAAPDGPVASFAGPVADSIEVRACQALQGLVNVDASVDVRAQLKQASANMPLVPAFLEAFVTAPVSRLGCGAPLDALGRISARREQHKSIEALRSSRVAEWVASARASGISEQLLLHAQRFHDTGHDVSRCRAPECPQDQPRRAAFELFCRRLRKFDADADESRRTQSLLDEKAAAPIHRYLVSERFGRSLADVIATEPGPWIPHGARRRLLRDIIALVAGMHAKGWIHRDLKSANILCHTLGDEAVLRLCDLGSARQVGPDGGVLVESSPYTTSRSYRAPELLCGATRYGTAVDVWALACTLGEVWLGLEAQGNKQAAACITGARGGGSDYPLSGEEAIDLCCGIFHGFSSDGAQLMHVINVLGAPTASDVAAMRVSGDCLGALQSIIAALHGGSKTASPPASLGLCGFLAHRHVPVDIAHAVSRMLTWSPASRLSAADALWHPAFLPCAEEVGGASGGSTDSKATDGMTRADAARRPLAAVAAPPPDPRRGVASHRRHVTAYSSRGSSDSSSSALESPRGGGEGGFHPRSDWLLSAEVPVLLADPAP